MRREGEWSNLDYSYHLGFGARRLAALSLGETTSSFAALCQTMKRNPQYSEAKDFLDQAERLLLSSYHDLLRKVQIMGVTLFQDELKVDAAFWAKCSVEWGAGPGYKERVTRHNRDWFRLPERKELEVSLNEMLEREWVAVLTRINDLFEVDG